MSSFFFVAFSCFVVSTLALPRDDGGYFLALKVVQDPIWGNKSYNHATMFKVGFDGSISKWWNISFNENIGPISYGAFAFDSTKNIVYLPTISQITGVSQNGMVTINAPLQTNYQFWNYFYEPQSDTLVGSCSDTTGSGKNNPMWYWCELSVRTGALLHSTVKLPYTDGLAPFEPNYSVDLHEHLIWYKSYNQLHVFAADYLTGKLVFTSGETQATCVAYNGFANKAYILSGNGISQYYSLSVFELLSTPQHPKEIIKLPKDNSFIISTFGSCGMIPKTNTLFVFMTNITKTVSIYNDSLMPTDLILADLTNLSFKQVSLDIGDNASGWNSEDILTGSIYVPN